jgi:hypothetical protein
MYDILSFNTFVTQDVLVFFYYIGALVMPIVLYYFRIYLIEHVSLIKTGYENDKKLFWLIMISIFLCMELCWRMMFEAMIGYFDMHDYLHIISQEMQNAR